MARARLRILVITVVTVALLGLLAFTVFPTRELFEQRAATRRAQERLDYLTEQTDALKARADKLNSDEEIERLAREDYGLVMPGEEAYVVLPPPLPPIDYPDFWLMGDADARDDADSEPK